jgi:hypothetical protein
MEPPVPDAAPNRRAVLLTSLISALGIAPAANASPLNPAQTIIRLPADLPFKRNPANPEHSVEDHTLVGDPTEEGLYFQLVRWWPGYMSSPHFYPTDRFCMVLSGTWWCNSGPDFDPAACMPAPAGSFVQRVARTPHYDGVIKSASEPAVIAICGIGPVKYQLVEGALKSPIKL